MVIAGCDLEEVAGLALAKDGGVQRTAPRAPVGWDQLLNCPWGLIDFESYRRGQLETGNVPRSERVPVPEGFGTDRVPVAISYYSSFGCPEPCRFCCSPEVTNRHWKAMPAERMLDDLQELSERLGFDVVRFHEANWGIAEKRVREFCQRGGPTKRRHGDGFAGRVTRGVGALLPARIGLLAGLVYMALPALMPWLSARYNRRVRRLVEAG